jgi:type I restriction enzyme S subunit
MKWSEQPLGRLAARSTSGGTPATGEPSYYGGEIPWLRTQEVNFNYIYDTEIKISDAGLENSAAKWIAENSVIVALYGNSAGRVAVNKIALTTNQACGNFTIDPTKADYRFIYYALLKDYAVLHGMAKGAAQNNLNLGMVKDYNLRVPGLPIQQRIASILSAYDEAIENNRRRMALLEKAARLLYQEWFVRLRFPGHEHTPVIKGLPKGWERKSLSELTSFLKRGLAPHYDDDAPGLVINQKCVRDGRLNMNLARHQSREFATDRQVQVGDVLVNSTGEGTLGRVAQVRETIENCTVDTHVTIVRPKPNVPINYFGMAVMSWEPRFSTMGRGATNQTELSPTAIGAAGIVIPHSTVLKEFEAFAAPIATQVSNLVSQNNKLRAARDLLLPRLMSGEIEV